MRIFIIGQCSLHWGRMENGNIGNYYIVEPLVRELHRVFPSAEIATTMQMTESFRERENINVIPMELYYSWNENDLTIAKKEYEIAKNYNKTGVLTETTPYIDEVMKSDLIIDFSGEMWSTVHAELVGKDRFLVGALKDRVAQLLGKKTVMIATGQGPFTPETIDFAKEVYSNFDRIYTRERQSIQRLKDDGFNTKNTRLGICPSFLFEPCTDEEISDVLKREKIIVNGEKSIGFLVCGFNMLNGPYDMKNRPDEDFNIFAEAVEFIVKTYNKRVVLMSHQNGFELPPNFKLINGRDYYVAKQLYEVLQKRNNINIDMVHLISQPYTPKQTKAIIRNLEMFVTGRLHSSVAGVSSLVPTVVMMHGHGPYSHKTIGFFEFVDSTEFVAQPKIQGDIINKIKKCYENREQYRKKLETKMPEVRTKIHNMFDELKGIVNE